MNLTIIIDENYYTLKIKAFNLQNEFKINKNNNIVSYIKSIKNDDLFINIIYGNQLYYSVFNNDYMQAFYNEKSCILILFDYMKERYIFIDCLDVENENELQENFMMEEMKKNNIDESIIKEFIKEARF